MNTTNTLRLKINMADKEYIISTLRVNEKNECFYLMHQPEEANKYTLNLNTNKLTTRIDKISFHTDATHIKVKNHSDDYEERLGKIDRILLPTNNEVKPLLVESFMLNNNPSCILATDVNWKATYEKVITTTPQIINFSLILLLVPHHLETEDVLLYSKIVFNDNEIDLFQFKEEGHSIGRVKAFENYDILIFTTPYIPQIKSPENLMPKGPLRIINYESPQDFLAKIAMNKSFCKPHTF